VTDKRDLRTTLADDLYDGVRRRSYIALDVPSREAAIRLVDTFGDAVDGYKVGLELFHAAGLSILDVLANAGKRVFLDVKLHDIPNTVASALKSICRHEGVEMVNVHALGGPKMLAAAREAVDRAAHKPLLIGVTVLTSMRPSDMAAVGLGDDAAASVARLTKLVADAGLDGVVASALELAEIVRVAPSGFVTVIPGTRPRGADVHDQVRVLTAGEAMAAGASHLVLGRAVTQVADPLRALQQIWEDMRVHLQTDK